MSAPTSFDLPVMVASGCGGTGRELAAYAQEDGLAGIGGFVTRTLTMDPRAGGRVRVEESPAGLVRAHRLQNPGLDRFLMTELPWLAQQGVRTFVSIAGATLAEYAEITRRLVRAPGVAGIELNLAVDDPRRLGVFDATEPFQAARVVTAVRAELPVGVALHVKLPAVPSRIATAARAVAEAGADALVVGGALPAALDNGTPAELSGPAVRPVALRCLAEVRTALPGVPLIAVGGIATADDARGFLSAGAVAVQVGTALLHDPTTVFRIASELATNPGDDL
ncbi:nitronate monooxygenase [Nocardioides cavernaquae]|uniref:Dihydroorotate dehydrogenase n=1 Tax=Nocardioides cavernaquae TaxID=2321396 RepID=A0A3A5H9P6_9ACTN|nr:nitronate monooxygenase [Nocardioides cavernaquae]RJS47346.1 dihydroorotate dehydrogenase [Nocardioides cavernaquae]